MHLSRSALLGSLLIGAVLISACAAYKKPTFTEPEVIINHPPQAVTTAVTSPATHSSSKPAASGTSSQTVTSSTASSSPKSLVIDVPFAPQAPHANWDALHEEACEEMSLLMVHHFLAGTSLSLDQAEAEVQALIAWERGNGYSDDVTVDELGAIAKAQYGYRYRLLTNVTADMLRSEVAKGNPVIIPAAGQTLGNPYFSGEGPPYHMLVITGYSGNGFITNDPGTKRGSQYWYAADVLVNAIHDWTGSKDAIRSGPKNALVIEQ